MIEIGKFNTLKILRDTEPGLFLGDDQDCEVLLLIDTFLKILNWMK